MVSRRLAAWLLAGGFIGPILFVVVVLVSGWTRPGYDPTSMYLSYLSRGPGGWLLVATTLVSGVLIAGGGVGLGLVLGRASLWGPTLVGLCGLGVVVTGILLPDAARGYPPGTPLGPPSNPSLAAVLHDVAAAIAMLCVVGAMLVLARRFAGEAGGARWAAFSRLSAIGATVFLVASFFDSSVLGVLERIGVVIATGWVAQVMWRFRREVAAA